MKKILMSAALVAISATAAEARTVVVEEYNAPAVVYAQPTSVSYVVPAYNVRHPGYYNSYGRGIDSRYDYGYWNNNSRSNYSGDHNKDRGHGLVHGGPDYR